MGEIRDLGLTLEQQLLQIDSINNDPTTRRAMTGVARIVHEHPEKSPQSQRATILGVCAVGDDGNVVFPREWDPLAHAA
jgi:hypothetical protein